MTDLTDVQTIDTVAHGRVAVGFFRHYGDDLKRATPSIRLAVDPTETRSPAEVDLTWDEARALAAALLEIADLGENG